MRGQRNCGRGKSPAKECAWDFN